MVIYSHSRLSTFEQCKLKFKYRYIDKIKPEIEKSIEAHLGTCVHHALEWLYIEVKNGNLPSLDDIILKYTEKWHEDWVDEISIVRKNLSKEDYFNKGIQFLINYYMKHKPFNDGTLEMEKKIIIDLTGEGKYVVQGFIDRLVYNKERGIFEIHDYKTANLLPKKEKFDKDRQLALYAIGVKELYGQEKEVLLVWHYLAHNTRIISKRTPEELEKLKVDTVKLIDEIETTSEFSPNKSILCNWCEYKSICPAFGGSPEERQSKL